MIRLRLLGPVALERSDGELIGSVLAQPKRFALLAYLAAAHPPVHVRRDTLVGLLWPELDEEHARMNLRQSLYRLRRSLGAAVLTGKGEEFVGVDPERLWCDAAAFEKALDDGKAEHALALYRGPLLEGFHLSDTGGLERWLEDERRRLALRAITASAQLTLRAEADGDGGAARRWAERTIELAPYDEDALRRYVALLNRQGDRAAAIMVYERFTRRLSEDLELEPSAETNDLVDRIRQRREEPAEPRVSQISRARPALEPAAEVSMSAGGGVVEEDALEPDPLRQRLVAYLAGLLVVAALGYLGLSRGNPAATSGEDAEIHSLAVLPLRNLSGDPEQQYLADGMTEALIAELGRLEGLRVISHRSAMRYRGTDELLPEISRELDVDALVEGSVLREGDEVRIALRLMHGPTERRLWSASYHEEFGNLFDLQERVARAVAGEIRSSLASGPPTLSESSRSPHPRAYEAYLKGRYQSARLGRDALLTAIASLRTAISIDSTFAPAYAALAEVCSMPGLIGDLTSLNECHAWATRAVRLDDGLAEAHAALGFVRMLEWDWEGSERAFLRAIELRPGSVMAHQWYAELLRRTLRPEQALVEIRRAEALDPLNLFVKTMVGWPLLSLRRYQDAIAQWNEVLELDPDYGLAHYNRGLAYWMMGRPREALEAADLASRRFGEDAVIIRVLRAAGHALAGEEEMALETIAEVEARQGRRRPGMIAAVYLTLGLEEEALVRLEQGYAQRDPWLPNTISEPLLDGLRDDARFLTLVRKMGLEPELIPVATR